MNDGEAPDSAHKDNKDSLLQDYNSVLRESAVLTTFSGFLFGFLLNISVNFPKDADLVDKVILATALFTITLATSLFIMPVIYHHIQFPYNSLEKFKKRSHRFLIFGIIPALVTLYLGLDLALVHIVGNVSFAIAAIPMGLVYLFYRMRK